MMDCAVVALKKSGYYHPIIDKIDRRKGVAYKKLLKALKEIGFTTPINCQIQFSDIPCIVTFQKGNVSNHVEYYESMYDIPDKLLGMIIHISFPPLVKPKTTTW